MSAIKIRKIGNSLGLILPKEIQYALEVKEGDLVEFTKISNKKIVLENALPHHSEWIFEGSKDLSKEDLKWLNADLDEDNVPTW